MNCKLIFSGKCFFRIIWTAIEIKCRDITVRICNTFVWTIRIWKKAIKHVPPPPATPLFPLRHPQPAIVRSVIFKTPVFTGTCREISARPFVRNDVGLTRDFVELDGIRHFTVIKHVAIVGAPVKHVPRTTILTTFARHSSVAADRSRIASHDRTRCVHGSIALEFYSNRSDSPRTRLPRENIYSPREFPSLFRTPIVSPPEPKTPIATVLKMCSTEPLRLHESSIGIPGRICFKLLNYYFIS